MICPSCCHQSTDKEAAKRCADECHATWGNLYVLTSEERPLACIMPGEESLGERRANAMLMAAAPGLLEVVDELLHWYDGPDEGRPPLVAIVERATAAARKARGR